MTDTVELDIEKYRLFVAIQYLNASAELYRGLEKQQGKNDFHFLATLRSFIEYTRRGIWFLEWASDKKLKQATKLTFKQAGSPPLHEMDARIQEALGQVKQSPLMNNVPKMNEPFIDCLHALTHGNPIAVRMLGIGLSKIFQTEGLLARAALDLGIFRILLYRRISGEDSKTIWAMLSKIHNKPDDINANEKIAALLLKKSGKLTLLQP